MNTDEIDQLRVRWFSPSVRCTADIQLAVHRSYGDNTLIAVCVTDSQSKYTLHAIAYIMVAMVDILVYLPHIFFYKPHQLDQHFIKKTVRNNGEILGSYSSSHPNPNNTIPFPSMQS